MLFRYASKPEDAKGVEFTNVKISEYFDRHFPQDEKIPGVPRKDENGYYPVDRSLDQSDVIICTEPTALCLPLALAFPDRPIVGYFGNPLAAYVPADFLRL